MKFNWGSELKIMGVVMAGFFAARILVSFLSGFWHDIVVFDIGGLCFLVANEIRRTRA